MLSPIEALDVTSPLNLLSHDVWSSCCCCRGKPSRKQKRFSGRERNRRNWQIYNLKLTLHRTLLVKKNKYLNDTVRHPTLGFRKLYLCRTNYVRYTTISMQVSRVFLYQRTVARLFNDILAARCNHKLASKSVAFPSWKASTHAHSSLQMAWFGFCSIPHLGQL